MTNKEKLYRTFNAVNCDNCKHKRVTPTPVKVHELSACFTRWKLVRDSADEIIADEDLKCWEMK